MRTRLIRFLLALLSCVGLAFIPNHTAPVAPVPAASAAPAPAAPAAPAVAAVAAPPKVRPNILLIVADDMSATDLRWMPKTRRLLGDHGTTMSSFLSNHPLCCPARAEILTGQYGQNNGVHYNEGPWGGFHASDPEHSVAVWLQRAGYRTAFVGKYLNHYYGKDGVLPGWTEFNPTTRKQYAPYGFSALYNGHERVVENVYTGDWVGRQTSRYIRKFTAAGRPFFVYASQLAPHNMHVGGKWVNPVPAPRHRNVLQNVRPVSFKNPAYNKESYVTKGNRPVSRKRMINLNRRRLQSLQAVDEANAAAIRTLRRLGQLDNTYVFFTSDNGWHLGEHRHVGKGLPYSESLKVPMLVRGPGIPVGARRSQLTEQIDLAPTFLALAKATSDQPVDGTSLLPVLRRNAHGYTTALIQNGDAKRPWGWRGVRTKRYTFVRYAADGHVLLFDRRKDPHELRNVARSPAYRKIKEELRGRLQALRSCAGVACRSASR